MFDDYVEHSGAPGVASPSYGTLPEVQHQGFEALDDGVGIETMETGYFSSAPGMSKANEGTAPIFSLSHVQFSLPSSLISLSVSANLLCMALQPLSIILIDLTRPEELITIDLPKPAQSAAQVVITRIFGDPNGKHLLIGVSSGDTFYLPTAPSSSRKPRPLRLRSPISSVAWSPQPTLSKDGSPQTEALLGSPTGQIFTLPLPPSEDIFKSVTKTYEKDYILVYTLPDGQEITGLGYGFWTTAVAIRRKEEGKRAWMVITTRERVYEVQATVGSQSIQGGKGGWAEEVFRGLKEGIPKFQELPGIGEGKSQLRFYSPASRDKRIIEPPAAVAWATGPGLYYSLVPLPTSPPVDIFSSPILLPYPTSSLPPPSRNSRKAEEDAMRDEVPVAIALTDWHIVMLFEGRAIGIEREGLGFESGTTGAQGGKVIWEMEIPLKVDEKTLGLSFDPMNRTCWAYTNKAIYEIVVTEEDRDVWKGRLARGDFVGGLAIAKTSQHKDLILSAQADSFFQEARYMQAAQTYAKCSKGFEEVVLRFVDVDERDALRVYLAERLGGLDKGDLTQRMMLATWLVEIYLSKCNTLEDIIAAEAATTDVESLRMELSMMEEDLRNFMTTYQANLDRTVMYELIQSHGRTDVYLFFAALGRDFGLVMEHWVTEEKWKEAIDVLNRQESLDLYYRFAAILMRNAPMDTVDSWLKQPALDPRRLIPAMLAHQQRFKSPTLANPVTRYLSTIIERGSTDSTIHNLLITVLAGVGPPSAAADPLLAFLSSCPDDPFTGRPYYDLDYALRLCRQHNRVEPCVMIYSKMGLYEASVDLALETGDLELAQINAEKPEDDEILRKKLWLKIAKYVVQEKNDIKSAMNFLEITPLLKIEDILPFFPDFIIIDDFKDSICLALESYAQSISQLKEEMNDATRSAENIKAEIDGLQARFMTVHKEEKCDRCDTALMTRQFYVFPCQHVFHADCLITLAKDYLPPPTLRRIIHLQTSLLQSSGLGASLSSRALLSSQLAPSPEPDSTAGNATSLLLGITGRSKLKEAGDKLRELIVPDVLASAVSVVGAGVGMGGGKSTKTAKKRLGAGEEAKREELRRELEGLLCSGCVICEGSVAMVDKPFVTAAEDDGSWEI